MKIKLFYKVFLAFLLTSFMIVALMVGIMRFHVVRNFTDFMNKMEMEKLDGIVKALAENYQEYGGWEVFRRDPVLWRDVLRSGRQGDNGAMPVPPPAMDRRPRLNYGEGDRILEGERMDQENRRRPPDRHLVRILRRLTLLDSEKRRIVGMRLGTTPGAYTLREIVVGDKTVGWLALHRPEHMLAPPEIDFMQQQSRVFFMTGGGVLLLAVIFSYIFSRHLLRPIRQLTAGTRALASLKFHTRIEVHTGDELGQLAHDFNVMAHTLENYEKRQKQWVSDIAHELRTPLSILRGEIEAMQDGVREVTRMALDSLHSEILHIGKIVNDLHELSMADNGVLELNRNPVNPVEVLEGVLNLFRTRFVQEQITVIENLRPEGGYTVQGDADRLAQLYTNILANTLRYADKPGTLVISREYENGFIRLGFEDSGPGVPEEAVEHLFDRLYRVDSSRARARGGSGLGLAICKAIAEAHGGRITAQNAPSGGLKVEVLLPLEGYE